MARTVFSMPPEPKPANQATTQPARTMLTVAPTVANRRGFMIAASKGSMSQIAQPITRRRRFSDHHSNVQGRKRRIIIFSANVARKQRDSVSELLCVLRSTRSGEASAACGLHKRGRQIRFIEHDPEKWKPVFPRDKRGTRLRGDHAQTKS